MRHGESAIAAMTMACSKVCFADQAAVRRACSLTVEKGRVRVPRLHSLRQSRLSVLALYVNFLSHTLFPEMVDQRAQRRGDLSPAQVEQEGARKGLAPFV